MTLRAADEPTALPGYRTDARRAVPATDRRGGGHDDRMTHVAIVTGAGSGIGRALSERLVARGSTVVMADRSPDVEDVAAVVGATGAGSTVAAVLDVRDAAAVAAVVDDAVGRLGRLDVMINNAGIGVGGPAETLSAEHWDRVLDVNVRGVTNGVAAAYPVMVEQGFGHLVNTASLAGLVPSPLLAPYAMSKHAVVGMSLSLRLEAQVHGVRVSALCPGPVDTPILDSPGPDDLPQALPGVSARELLARTTRRPPYPVERLAADALHGMDRNEALIVVPRSARWIWRANRVLPDLVARASGLTVRWALTALAERQGDPQRRTPGGSTKS